MKSPEQKEMQLPLARLFGTPNAKTLDFLLANEGLKYSEDEISKLAKIPKRTLRRSLQSLLDERMIKCSRKNRSAYYYTADLSSPRVGGLLGYMNSTLISNLENTIRVQKS